MTMIFLSKGNEIRHDGDGSNLVFGGDGAYTLVSTSYSDADTLKAGPATTASSASRPTGCSAALAMTRSRAA